MPGHPCPVWGHLRGEWRLRSRPRSDIERVLLGCVGSSGRRRGSGSLSGCTAGAVETGQYFSGTASDKLGHLQYFLSKLGYPSRCCGHPRALGSWVTQKWSSPCPVPSGIPAPIPRPWQQSLGGSGFPAPNGTKPIHAGSLSQTIGKEAFRLEKKNTKGRIRKGNASESSLSAFMFCSLEKQNNCRKVFPVRGGGKLDVQRH